MEANGKKRRRRSIRNLNRISTSTLALPGTLLDSTSCEEKSTCYGSTWLEEGEDTNMDSLVKSFSQLVCAETRVNSQSVRHSQEPLDTSKECGGKTWDGTASTGSSQTHSDVLNLTDSQSEGKAPGSNYTSVDNGGCFKELSQQINLPSFVSDVKVDEWLFDNYKPEEINRDRVSSEEEKSKGSSFTKNASIETVGRTMFCGSYHHKDFDSLERKDLSPFPESIEKARCHDIVSSSPGLSPAADKSEELSSLTSESNSSELRSTSADSWNNNDINLDKLTPEHKEVGVTLGASGGDEALNEAFMSNLCLSDSDRSLDTSKNLNRTFTIMPEVDTTDASVADDIIGSCPHVLKSTGTDDSFSPSYPPYPVNQTSEAATSPVRSLSETVLGSSPASIIQQLSSKLRSLQATSVGSNGHDSITLGKPYQEKQLGYLELTSIDTIDVVSAKKFDELNTKQICDGFCTKESDGISINESDGMSTANSDRMISDKSEGMSTDKSKGVSTDKSKGVSTDTSEGMISDKSEGMSTDKSKGVSTDKSEGMSSDKPEGMSTDKSEGVSSDKSEGMSTDKSEGMSNEKFDGMSSENSDGMVTKKSDVTNTKKLDKLSQKKSDGISTMNTDGMSLKKCDGMSSKKSDGIRTKKCDVMSFKKSDGMNFKKSDGMGTKKSNGRTTEKSDRMSFKKSDGISTKKSDGTGTKKSREMRNKVSPVVSTEESDVLSMLHDNITEESNCEPVSGKQTSAACHNAPDSGHQDTGGGLTNCTTDRVVLGEVPISGSVLESHLQMSIHSQNSPKSLNFYEVVNEVDPSLDSLVPADSSTIPFEPHLTSTLNRPQHLEGKRGKTHRKKKDNERTREPEVTRSDESVNIYSALPAGRVRDTSRRTTLKVPDTKGSICSVGSKPKKAKRRSMPTMKVFEASYLKNGSMSVEGKKSEECSNTKQSTETLKLIISRRPDSGKFEVFSVDSKELNRNKADSSAGSLQEIGTCENEIETKSACAVLTAEDLNMRAGETNISSAINLLASTEDKHTTEAISCLCDSRSEGGQGHIEEGGRNSVACIHQEWQEEAHRKISERKARRRSSRYFHPQEMDNFRQTLVEEGEVVSCKSTDNTDISDSTSSPKPSAVCQSLEFEWNIQNNKRKASASRAGGNTKQKRGRNETKATFENEDSIDQSNMSEEAAVKQRNRKRKSQKFNRSASDSENIEPVERESSESEPRPKETAMDTCEPVSGIECPGDNGDEHLLCATGVGVESAVVVKKKPVRTKKNRKSWDLYKGQAKGNDEVAHRQLRARKHVDYSADALSDEEKLENLTREGSKVPECVPYCLSPNEDCIPEDLENLYRNKNYVPPKCRAWETIKEYPTDPKQPFNKQRFRRFLPFDDKIPAAKLKRREKKAQSVFSKQSLSWTPITDEMCERKLTDLSLCLESPSPEKSVYF